MHILCFEALVKTIIVFQYSEHFNLPKHSTFLRVLDKQDFTALCYGALQLLERLIFSMSMFLFDFDF